MKKNARKTAQAQRNAPADEGKRNTLKLLRAGAIGAVALGGIGVFSIRAVQATVAEQDLTTIGQGRPTIVQIHDPSCSLCTELQRQTKSALKAMDATGLDYRVANIRSDVGASFANGAGAAHVTLLLYNAEGTLVRRMEGVRQADELRGAFEALLR
ncbi:MAG: hypothetical protein ACI9KS_001828 [Sulfitobacter sp.]|jgi:hypothetical protein